MSLLRLGTATVSMDEPCWSLKEVIEQSPGSKGMRRYMVLKVIRGDRLAEFRKMLGPVKRFKAPEFVIPGGVADAGGRFEILHTVGELVDIAEHMRSDAWQRPEPKQPFDLIQGYHDLHDKRKLARKRRSMVGALVRVQRD